MGGVLAEADRKTARRIEMRSLRSTIGLAAAVAFAVWAGAPAAATNLDLDESGAAVAVPIITGGSHAYKEGSSGAVTLVTVTNTGPAVRLHVNLISGDYYGNYDKRNNLWQSYNFDCDVTASETVLFVFEPGYRGVELSYECGVTPFPPGVEVEREPFDLRNGIMFITLEDPETGETLNSDQLFADWVVIDHGNGAAFSAGAIAFQGGVAGGGVPDRKYRFDGVEYRQFPSAVATNFIAPDYELAAYLVLFTLDGTAGNPPPASVSIKFYNDDEVVRSAGWDFDCFTIVELRDIDPRFDAYALGSPAGHLVMTPDVVNFPDIAHDSQYDGGGVLGVRKTPVHGWLVQTIEANDVPEDTTSSSYRGEAAWARTLAQSQLPMEPSAGDVPTFAAR
jgi:hypothetical protein